MPGTDDARLVVQLLNLFEANALTEPDHERQVKTGMILPDDPPSSEEFNAWEDGSKDQTPGNFLKKGE